MLKLVLLTLASTAFALGSASGISNEKAPVLERDARILVQLDSSTRGKTRQAVLNEQNSLLNTISTTITTNYDIVKRFTNVSNVLLLNVPSSYVDDIRSLEAVKDINYDTLHAVKYDDGAKPIVAAVHNESVDNASAETMNKPAGTSDGEGVLVAVLDNGFQLTHEAFTAMDNDVEVKLTQSDVATIVSENEDDLHAAPGSGHTLYYNNKVPFYYDYGGSTNVRNSAGTPDNDVLAEDSHGTHVASTVAASGPYKGIAPKAQLALMKVFTEYTPTAADAAEGYTASSGAYDSAVLMAIEDAAIIGADILSMSFGSDLNDFELGDIAYQIINDLNEHGIFSNVAAGNAGKSTYDRTGFQYWSTDTVETGILGSYANTTGATIIAAGQPNWQFYETALLVNGQNISYEDQVTNYNSSSGQVVYNPERHLSDLTVGGQTTFDWVKVPNWGETKDYENLSVAGKIAVVDRGETSFESKVRTAYAQGAVACAIINNDASDTDFTFRMDFAGYSPEIPVITILFRDKNTFDSTGGGTLEVLVNTVADNPTAKQMASFSSDGARYDLEMKPDITTPGENIRGAVVSDNNAGYEYYSGTSMATPNYSGAQAVLLGENLDNPAYRSTLVTRTMSTAQPIFDELGENHRSVKFQGAGMLDMEKALNSEVFLEGLNAKGEGIRAAKIQLYNNADIAKGDVKLSFLAHNEGANAATYKAKTLIYAPKITTYDAELYPDLAGKEVMDIKLDLLETAEETITIAPGSSTITLQTHTLSNATKEYLNEKFEYGVALEGFVILTPTETTNETLNIPFLGFYGDYSAAPAVEPFSFEKDPNKIYNSDLLNNLARKGLGKDLADFGSAWVVGNWTDMEEVDITPMLLNDTNIFELKDGNKNKVVPVGTNPYTGQVDPNNLYFGNNGFANTMIIQQYVNRSVSNNTITLKHKASGETVLVDHMFDSLFGEDGFYSLFKSHAVPTYLSSGIIAHRAYTIIPLFDMDSGELYPDGEYEMEFNYELTGVDGGVQTLKYDLVVDSEAPAISNVETVKVKGETYVRIRYANKGMSYAAINGTRYEVLEDEKGCYVDVLQSNYTKAKQTVYAKTYNLALANGSMITNAYDTEYHLAVAAEEVAMSSKLTYEVTKSTAEGKDINLEFDVTVKKSNKTTTFENGAYITISLYGGLEAESLEIFAIDSKGKETKITNFEVFEGSVRFHIEGDIHFRVTSNKGVSPSTSSGGGCGGSISAASTLTMSVALTLLAFVIIRKKKEIVE